MRTWVVAYDFSEQARIALSRAYEQLGALGGGHVVLLYAHAPVTDAVGLDLGMVTTLGPPIDENAVTDSEQQLREQVPDSADPSITIERRVMTGRPADTVCDVAKEVGADQIVVGSHGRRGFERLILGSVAERIIRLAECPVLVVKSAST